MQNAAGPPTASSIPLERRGAVVLCGGASSRMGAPKHLLEIDGETLLARVVRLIRPAVRAVVVVAAPDQETGPVGEGPIVVRDERPHLGPAAGFLHGLENLPESVEAVFLAGCDAPFLRSDWVEFLFERLAADDAAVPLARGKLQPTSAVYRVAVARELSVLLQEGRRALHALLECIRVRAVAEDELRRIDPDLDCLRNVNDPKDFEDALRLARQRDRR